MEDAKSADARGPAFGLVEHAVASLATRELAEKVARPFDAAIELARQTAIAADGKGDVVITSVEVTVRESSSKREPIDSGPKKRVPIACGGGSCYTVCAFGYCVTVCIEWECAK